MSLVIQHARVFDGPHSTAVRIQNGVIAGFDARVEAGDEVVDARGATLLPGLIDAHVHLLPGAPHQALSFGVTTELDMFTKPDLLVRLRSSGGADFRSSGIGATAPGGHPSAMYAPIPYVEDPEAFVEARIGEGADYLKIIYDRGSRYPVPTLDRPTVEALTKAAHARNLLVTVHTTTCVAALDAVEAGADGLQHLPMDEELPDELVQALVAHNVFVTPTLATLENVFQGAGGATMLADPHLSPWLGGFWKAALTQVPTGWTDIGYDRALGNMRKLIDAGVELLAGTDVPNPGTVHGASLHRELELLVQAGLTPAQALRSATEAPARRFGLTDRGVVAPGKRADLVLVDGDPTQRITDTRRIKGIWRAGVGYDRQAFPGSEHERELITALKAQVDKVLDALPALLKEEEVIREDDDALLGYLRPCPDGTWLPCTVFGYPLGPPSTRDDAVDLVHERGLAVLAERWQVRDGDEWYACVIQEATRQKVRVQVVDLGHPRPYAVLELRGDQLRPGATSPVS
ncbi:amidohydrolase family protein [Labedaea rhizosphaerae]|uniref:Imidazolonepropionase-like amidohydrolase n=1 Tax=Labedaea rhizosphaerae TaxID=598644 RepID=A0A4R6SGC2_LABRH|nr:amidohydrolase family protein [Labedaea rhizosphaerae]TDP98166.1 imidazolonepropionase-like amidohydrolase [Labedaea rhizosphaerae]